MKSNNIVSILSTTALLTTIGTVAFSNSAKASGFKNIRIGDEDGFGFNYNDLQEYKGANGESADRDGNGILGEGDVLLDLTKDGKLSTGSKDNFDNRSELEKNNSFLTGEGFQDNGSGGSEFTDISLSTSYLNNIYGITPLQNESNLVKGEKKQVDNQLKTLNGEIKNFNSQLNKKGRQITNLTNQNKNQEKRNQDDEKKITNKLKKIDDLREEVSTLEDKLKNATKENQKEQAQKNINKKNNRIKSLEGEIDGTETKQGLRDKIAERDEIINLNNKTMETIEGKIEKINKNKAKKVAKRTTLKVKQTEIANKISNLNTEMEEKKAKRDEELIGGKIPQATFKFDFLAQEVNKDNPFYFNLLFGDYDVKVVFVQFSFKDGV